MNDSKLTTLFCPSINDFQLQIKYSRLTRTSHVNQIDMHSHRELELYINLTGDISFLVENTLYPVTRGDIIVAHPGDLHHCVYNSDQEHQLFWILVDIDSNRPLFDHFFEDIPGHYFSFCQDTKDELIHICRILLDSPLSTLERHYYFLRLLMILKENARQVTSIPNAMPSDLTEVLRYIDAHLSESIRVSDIAAALYLSESTIERRFKTYLNMRPLEFIHKKKMILAAELLRSGESVLNAGISAGYSDNSYFINIFKRFYGITPFQYKSDALTR